MSVQAQPLETVHFHPYPKIETLFTRDENFKIVVGDFKRPVFSTITYWEVTEKVDGTNIQIHYRRGADRYTIGGRTKNSQIPALLIDHINENVSVDPLREILEERELDSITLFGEGYGAKIQKGGGNYRPDQGFILFDVMINNRTWLPSEAVTETASRLHIPRVPILGIRHIDDIIQTVKTGFNSHCSTTTHRAEGIVGRTIEPLYDNRGKRLILKLKEEDFA